MKRKRTGALLAIVGVALGGALSCSDDPPADEGSAPDATTIDSGRAPAAPTGSANSSDGSPAADGASGACTSDDDCVGEQRCLFATGAACGSSGTCIDVPNDGPACADAAATTTACSCDGTPRDQLCSQPAGYTRGVIVHAGPCADGGEECTPGGQDCPGDQICGFRVADGCAVTAAHCFDGPDPTVAIPGYLLAACGCDGGVASTFPDNNDVVNAPVIGLGQCRSQDAGADAADAGDAD